MTRKHHVFLDDTQIKKLLGDIFDKYGYDFKDYSFSSVLRRIEKLMDDEDIVDFSFYCEKLLNESHFFNRFVEKFTVNVTEMYRDSEFFSYLSQDLIKKLATYPIIRIWHAGCSTGEEVISMAIMLKEANLLERAQIYATDINPRMIEIAKKATFLKESVTLFEENYIKSGGKSDFEKYYTLSKNKAVFDNSLLKNVHFNTHNLVTDQSFNEFNLIVCHNVMIYFNRKLQSKVLELFNNSLHRLGFLSLGKSETIMFLENNSNYKKLNKNLSLWQKII